MVESADMQFRTCRHCKKEKPLSDYPLTRGKYFWKCKECSYKKYQSWTAMNRDRSREIKNAYIEKHPDKNKESKHKYASSDRGKAKNQKWKQENKENINARNRELFAMRHRPLIMRLISRKERERTASGVFSKYDEISLFNEQNGACAGCHIQLSGEYHIDHIVPLVCGGSHWPENRQILCPKCNHRKGTKLPAEWQNERRRMQA